MAWSYSSTVRLGSSIDPERFVRLVREPLEQQDTSALAELIHTHWSDDQIIDLLDSNHKDARKLAALALGFVGDRRCVTALASCLRDPDPIVNQMAEHALWTVWFRSGAREAQEFVQRGTELLDSKQFTEALDHFTQATRIDPTYAEAFNQRSITQYLTEDFHGAADDAEVVVKLMPVHFGAWAGLGHCHAHLGQPEKALQCYRRALGINPYLHGIRQIAQEIQLGQCTCWPKSVR
jgi:tetratricopeptide (TPR) repeat protein